MNKKKLSVVISAFNEEKNIPECLASVAWADEIVVIDNTSSDSTAKIAKQFTKHVYIRKNNPMLNVNKNFGFTKATGEWILSLDADERVLPELAKEIQQILMGEEQKEGYKIPRRNIIFGKWIEHTGWYPDYQTRLFRKGKGKFAEKHVHELLTIDGEIGELRSPIEHINFTSIAQFVHKHMSLYAPNEADQLLQNGYIFSWADAIWFPLKEFLSRYFARDGYKDGLHGLMLSLFMAFYHLLIFAYIWEKKNFPQYNEIGLHDVANEIKRSNQHITHWIREKEIASTSSPFIKLYRKIKHH